MNKSVNNNNNSNNTNGVNNSYSQLDRVNNNNNNDLSTVYTQGEVISDEGEAVDSLMKELETNLPAPKLMNRERGSSNP
jgi:hypothetical protein